MTKISTLKHACAYIRSLQAVLEGSVNQQDLEVSRGQTTYPWVLSSMLNEAAMQPQDTWVEAGHRGSSASPTLDVPHVAPQADLMSLLCDASDPPVLDDSMESFPYLTAMSEADQVAMMLLGIESPPASFLQDLHTQFAVC